MKKIIKVLFILLFIQIFLACNSHVKDIYVSPNGNDKTSGLKDHWKHPKGALVHAMHHGEWGGFHYQVTGIYTNGRLILKRRTPKQQTFINASYLSHGRKCV